MKIFISPFIIVHFSFKVVRKSRMMSLIPLFPHARPSQQLRKISRSRTDRILFGVAGGLGKYLGIDSNLVRLAFVILMFAEGSGFILYLLLAIILPLEPVIDPKPHKANRLGAWNSAPGKFLPNLAGIAVVSRSQYLRSASDRSRNFAVAGQIFQFMKFRGK